MNGARRNPASRRSAEPEDPRAWALLPDVLRDVCGADVSKCFESCQRVGSLREACVSVSRGYVDLRQGDVAE
eukprot:1862139-Rhodomonas_salina.5